MEISPALVACLRRALVVGVHLCLDAVLHLPSVWRRRAHGGPRVLRMEGGEFLAEVADAQPAEGLATRLDMRLVGHIRLPAALRVGWRVFLPDFVTQKCPFCN